MSGPDLAERFRVLRAKAVDEESNVWSWQTTERVVLTATQKFPMGACFDLQRTHPSLAASVTDKQGALLPGAVPEEQVTVDIKEVGREERDYQVPTPSA